MRVEVVYASHFGSTRGIAEHIALTLRERGLIVDCEPADHAGEVVGASYDAYVVGSAIHGRHWLPSARHYVERNLRALRSRPTWLFSSGPIGERYIHAQQPIPKDVLEIGREIHPRGHEIFAGAFHRETADFSSLGWMERNVARHLLPVGDFRDWDAIARWAHGIASELGAHR